MPILRGFNLAVNTLPIVKKPATETVAVNPGEISIVFNIHSQLWMLIQYDLDIVIRGKQCKGKLFL